MKKGQEYQIDITDIKFPGMGIGVYEGKNVYIKGAVPGQKVLSRIIKKKKSKIEGIVVDVIKKADYEIEPKCEHFDMCGGCLFQFVPYEKQLEFKKNEVIKLFENAGIEGFEILGIKGSPEVYEYRNKMEFTFGDLQRDGEINLGMHKRCSAFSVLNTTKCMIVDEDYRNITETVINYFREKGLPKYRTMSHEGYLRNLVIRKAKNTGEILINIVTTTQMEFDFSEFTSMLKSLNYKGTLKGILHTYNDSLSDVVKADKIDVLYGRDYIMEELLGLKFKISPFSFFQTNSKGAEVLYTVVKNFLGDDLKDKTVFDLYCGTGTIGQIVSPNAKKVVGIELIEEAVKSAKENAELNGIDNCEFIAGDIKDVIQNVNEKPDTIILDPPRPGVHPKALKYVLDFNAKEVVYVSCNPKTLVQDLKEFIQNGYEVKKVQVVDMFPHTPHVEVVTLLTRNEVTK